MKKIIFAVLAFGFLEMAVLILVGKAIGVLPTLLLITLTSIYGILITKKRGASSIQEIKNSLANGQPPGVPMIETFMVFIGGILLVLPGFVTDIIGLLFVLKLSQNLFKPAIFYVLRKKMKSGQVVIYQR